MKCLVIFLPSGKQLFLENVALYELTLVLIMYKLSLDLFQSVKESSAKIRKINISCAQQNPENSTQGYKRTSRVKTDRVLSIAVHWFVTKTIWFMKRRFYLCVKEACLKAKYITFPA